MPSWKSSGIPPQFGSSGFGYPASTPSATALKRTYWSPLKK